MILAIDPGPKQTAWCRFDGTSVTAGIVPNEALLSKFYDRSDDAKGMLAIEMIASYGMGVGKEVFDTCVWIGRFIEAWGMNYQYVFRKDVKVHHCHTVKATDSNIRFALIDRFGEPGTKRAPGFTYGLKKDMWSAFAIAVYAHDKTKEVTT